ncbi:hypothetical protein [Pelagibius sp.]
MGLLTSYTFATKGFLVGTAMGLAAAAMARCCMKARARRRAQ